MNHRRSWDRLTSGLLGLGLAFWVGFLCVTGVTPVFALEESQRLIPASFANVAQEASPAVVNISTEKTVKGSMGFRFHQPDNPDDPFNKFFERFFGDQAPPSKRKERSLGSGFLIDPTGLIITNNHVVEGAEDILVLMSDEKEFHAEILGRDPKTDLALIKIKSKSKFPYLELGDSSKVRIGDWVVAIGNPFGLDHTVTAGILSGRGRAIGSGPYDNFLQTDASINPGNSGGPLLNLKGEVIGINTAIIRGGTGIGFAIPTSMAKKIVLQLRENGKVTRGWLGVLIQKVTPELAKSFGLSEPHGALVADVNPDGPAKSGGIKRGDIIVEFNGQKIKEWSDLPAIVADTQVGAAVEVKVVRDGKEKNFTIKIAELKEDRQTEEQEVQEDRLGLTVRDLTPELAEKLGLTEMEGVVVWSVADAGPATEAGIKPMDLILEVNRQPVGNQVEYNKITREIEKGDTVLFLIRRGSNTLFFTVEVE